MSPDESEVVYLSDSGGHGNLWVARTDGSGARQITFERDPAVSVGVPVWSPTGSDIVFILTRPGAPGLSLINRDGSGLRQFTSNGVFGNWSADGQWILLLADERRHMVYSQSPTCRKANDDAAVRHGHRSSSGP